MLQPFNYLFHVYYNWGIAAKEAIAWFFLSFPQKSHFHEGLCYILTNTVTRQNMIAFI
jgi:hypothetical protein